MKPNHVHFKVKNLNAALDWLEGIWETKPVFQNPRMAVIPFGDLTYVLDADEEDSPATIAFQTENCDEEFANVVRRGAQVIAKPEDQSWGVRAAYLKGPGRLTFEIEQRIDG